MSLVAWIFRAVVVLLLVRMIASALFSSSRPRQAQQAKPGSRPAERVGGTLVRDPQCGTYLPQARAIRASAGADVHYFCSETCRDAYRAAHSSVA